MTESTYSTLTPSSYFGRCLNCRCLSHYRNDQSFEERQCNPPRVCSGTRGGQCDAGVCLGLAGGPCEAGSLAFIRRRNTRRITGPPQSRLRLNTRFPEALMKARGSGYSPAAALVFFGVFHPHCCFSDYSRGTGGRWARRGQLCSVMYERQINSDKK